MTARQGKVRFSQCTHDCTVYFLFCLGVEVQATMGLVQGYWTVLYFCCTVVGRTPCVKEHHGRERINYLCTGIGHELESQWTVSRNCAC